MGVTDLDAFLAKRRRRQRLRAGLVGVIPAFVLALTLTGGSSVPRTAPAVEIVRGADPLATPPTIAGRASVIDGDTLDLHGQRIRLHGIDAPEADQACQG